MLIIETYLDKSPLHGIGLFAGEDVPKGTIMWVFNPQMDSVIRKDEMGDTPEHVRAFLEKYAWTDNDGHWRIGIDNDKFINHSDTPNSGELQGSFVWIALHDIKKGDEITEDYSTFSTSETVQCGLTFDK